MMKKNVFVLLFVIITIIIGIATPAFAERLKYTGIARSTGGAVLGSATVTIYLAGTTTAANVYEASSGGDSVTSVISDSNGRWTFYADVADYAFTQEYKVVVTKDGYSTITLDNIFNLSLPTNAVGVLTNDGSGNYTWSASSFSESGDYSPTGTWDWSGATVSGLNATGLKLADASTITPPAAPPTVDGALRVTGTDGQELWFSTPDGCIMAGGSGDVASCLSPAQIWAILQSTVFPEVGGPSDEQLLCVDNTDDIYTIKACGEKITDESTASHAIYKDGDNKVQNQPTTFVANESSEDPAISLVPNICIMITNAGQGVSDVNNALPAVGAGKCFVALATTAQAGNYWRLTAAAVNTVCLNRTCGKDYIQFATPAVGDTFTCMSDGTSWYCYDRDSDAEAGDL
jgi:hypothetical protein